MIRSIFILLILFSMIFSQNHSGYAGSYQENGPDARSISMGNALTSANDAYFPAYFNPAGVASLLKRQAVFSHQFLSFDRRQSTIGFTMPLPPVGGLSIGWIGSGVNKIQGRDLTGNKTELLSSSEDMFIVSFGINPIKYLQVGGSVKILQYQLPNLDGNIAANGVGFDIGTIFKINSKIDIAFVLKNYNASYQWSNKLDGDLGRVYKDKFPMQLSSGIQYKNKSFLLVSDLGAYFIDSEYLDFNYQFGAEYEYKDMYFIRIGYRTDRLSFGMGIQLKQFNKFVSNLDYALVIEPVGGLSHIISYAITF